MSSFSRWFLGMFVLAGLLACSVFTGPDELADVSVTAELTADTLLVTTIRNDSQETITRRWGDSNELQHRRLDDGSSGDYIEIDPPWIIEPGAEHKEIMSVAAWGPAEYRWRFNLRVEEDGRRLPDNARTSNWFRIEER